MGDGPTRTHTHVGAGAKAEQADGARGLHLICYKNPSITGWRCAISERMVIGRTSGGDVTIGLSEDDKISRKHASIWRTKQGTFAIKDEASRNGTFVNGERITEATLGDGSIVRTGDSIFHFGALPAGDPVLTGASVGQSAGFVESWRAVDRVAPTDVPVLIQGETGSGKEGLANRIHALSGRAGPLVTVNCGAVAESLSESLFFGHKKGSFTGATADTKGYFSTASDGTLFLDEIGELPLSMQVKLLRVLDSGEFQEVGANTVQRTNARIVSATNVDLLRAIDAGRFRSDLYARLANYRIEVLPLRERKPDVILLCEHFYTQFSGEKPRWPVEAWEKLLLAPWPMNARDVRAVMQRLAVDRVSREEVCSVLDKHLSRSTSAPTMPLAPPEVDDTAARNKQPEPESEEQVRALLSEHKGNIKRISAATGHDRRQVYRWLERYGLNADDFRSET